MGYLSGSVCVFSQTLFRWLAWHVADIIYIDNIIFRQTANKILLNNCLNIKCTFNWRVNPSHLGFPTQIPVLCIKPSIRSRSQLCQYASAEVFVRWSGSMWNPLSTHTFLVSFFATFKNPRAHPLHVATGQVCGGEKESGATSFFFLFFVFFFAFHAFCSFFLQHQECLPFLSQQAFHLTFDCSGSEKL